MQDRFRLKFWDKTCKNIVYPSEDLIYKTENSRLDISGMLSFERFIPLQCTGLRDKNGKLVYFDDLVKNKWGQICKVIMQTDKQNYGRVVLQNIKYLNDEAHKNNIFIPAAINESVIIGNIYENPELLEEKWKIL